MILKKYKRQRNKLNNLKKAAKESYYSNLDDFLTISFNENKSNYWKLLRSLIKDSGTTTVIPPLVTDGSDSPTAFNDIEKANSLNTYFTSVSQINDSQHKLPPFKKRCENVLSDVNIIAKEISDLIISLPVNKASGPDNINHRLLKNIYLTISTPLSLLYNQSLQNSTFPSKWKHANVFKKGDRSKCSNYRPVSLLSSLGKILERLCFKRLHNYFNDNNLLYKYQSGFLPGHSTTYQLIEIYHQIYKALDKSEHFCILFCDVNKAFDRVWHPGLLHKLKAYGIDGKLLKWFDSYLSGRTQQVFVNGSFSNSLPLHAGVPQGSVLGPFLFLVSINEIADEMESMTRLFADDTSFGIASSDINVIEDKLNRDLETLNVWANNWLVNFNPDKTKFILFSHKRTDIYPVLKYNNNQLDHVESHQHLGVHLSHDAKWSVHIEHLVSKVSKMISAMRRVKYLVSRKYISKLFVIFIRPILEYACEEWSNCTA